MVRSSRKTYSALRRKNLVIPESSGDDHKFLVYIIDGHVIVRTKISHGPDHDLKESRIREMAGQCGLSRQQFLEFIDCTLSAEEFHQIQLVRLAERLKTSAS